MWKKAGYVVAVVAVLAMTVAPAFGVTLVTDSIGTDLQTSFDYMTGFWNIIDDVVWPLLGIGLVAIIFTLLQKARAMAGG